MLFPTVLWSEFPFFKHDISDDSIYVGDLQASSPLYLHEVHVIT
jgi:hypothetical protein